MTNQELILKYAPFIGSIMLVVIGGFMLSDAGGLLILMGVFFITFTFLQIVGIVRSFNDPKEPKP